MILSKLLPGEHVEMCGTKGDGFVTKIKLAFVEAFRRERVVDFGGMQETAIDYFANFEVIDVLSCAPLRPLFPLFYIFLRSLV